MDPRPYMLVTAAVRKLLAEMEGALQPSNQALHDAVWAALKPQLDALRREP